MKFKSTFRVSDLYCAHEAPERRRKALVFFFVSLLSKLFMFDTVLLIINVLVIIIRASLFSNVNF